MDLLEYCTEQCQDQLPCSSERKSSFK